MAVQALADGRVLAERIGGFPPRVVALHGWARSGADFVSVLAGLDAAAIHLPGFGPTAAPNAVWGTTDYADLVAEAIEPFAPVVVVDRSSESLLRQSRRWHTESRSGRTEWGSFQTRRWNPVDVRSEALTITLRRESCATSW